MTNPFLILNMVTIFIRISSPFLYPPPSTPISALQFCSNTTVSPSETDRTTSILFFGNSFSLISAAFLNSSYPPSLPFGAFKVGYSRQINSFAFKSSYFKCVYESPAKRSLTTKELMLTKVSLNDVFPSFPFVTFVFTYYFKCDRYLIFFSNQFTKPRSTTIWANCSCNINSTPSYLGASVHFSFEL